MIQSIETMKNAFAMTGQNVLVTGGNRGLGKGIAEAMAQCGANVAIMCRHEETAKETVAEISQYGGKYAYFLGDISNPASIRDTVAKIYNEFGNIDTLVNNSGISCFSELLDMDENLTDWHNVINTNLNGTVHMTYEVGKRMRDAGKGGNIINISSMAGQIVINGHPMCPYNSSKAAMNHFTRCAAAEMGKYNIRVNAVAPGYTHSELSNFIPAENFARIVAHMPLGRFGEPIEVGAATVFLASPAANQITGVVLQVDGGYSLSV